MKNLDRGKKWTPACPIFTCQKWTGLTKSGPGLEEAEATAILVDNPEAEPINFWVTIQRI